MLVLFVRLKARVSCSLLFEWLVPGTEESVELGAAFGLVAVERKMTDDQYRFMVECVGWCEEC